MAREAAALLACGDGALISHRSGVYLWSMLAERPGDVDVTLVGRRCRPKEGVRIHLANRIDQRDVRRRDGIPVTAPARTLIDFAGDAEGDELELAISEARVLRLIRNGEIEAALNRAGNRRGVARMREFLASEVEPGYTRSEAERRMRRLLKTARLPAPRCNPPLAGALAASRVPG
jgi:hypothetical protein